MVGRGLGESRGGVTGDVLKADFGEAAGRAHGGRSPLGSIGKTGSMTRSRLKSIRATPKQMIPTALISPIWLI